MGHKVKIHKITPTTGKEHGDIEMKDYVVLFTMNGVLKEETRIKIRDYRQLNSS